MTAVDRFWNETRTGEAIEILRNSPTVADACRTMSKKWGRVIANNWLGQGFRDAGLAMPSTYVGANLIASAEETSIDPISSLLELAKKFKRRGGLTLEVVADSLDVSPKRARELIERARDDGYAVDVAGAEIIYRPHEPPRTIAGVNPSGMGDLHRIAIVSDMHAGSKYHLGREMGDFVRRCYEEGIRDFFSPGDVLEGCYRHAQWELSHHSWEGQAAEFLENFPQLPGARLFFIDGNHDWTWTERDGFESGRKLVMFAKDHGRDDLFFLGSRGRLIKYGDSTIELWHPKKNIGYALSYQLQNKIRDTSPDRLPDLLFAGHWHKFCNLEQAGVWAFACPTFQHGDAPFGRSIGGDVAMGGLVLEWRKDTNGVVRDLNHEMRRVAHTGPIFDIPVVEVVA